jgi:MFS family permease
MVGGLLALSAASALFAFADRLAWLFLARLVQGAADAVTWVVGFALVADLYEPDERGRVMGFVMSGASMGFLVGPTLGGWLYETGGTRLPFVAVAIAAAALAAGFVWLQTPPARRPVANITLAGVLRIRSVAVCTAAVVAIGSTIAMCEPVLSMHLASVAGLRPAAIGLVFGVGAIVSMTLHPVFGRLADKWGGRGLTLVGLLANALALPLLSLSWSLASAIVFFLVQALAMAVAVTPSLTYMAEATSEAGDDLFGVTYGVYNFAWAVGILAGPAVGGFLFERMGFPGLALLWAPFVIVLTLGLALASKSSASSRLCSPLHRGKEPAR